MGRLLAIFGVVGLLSVFFTAGYSIYADRARTIADAEMDAANLRDALLEQTRQKFSTIKVALDSISEDIDPNNLRSSDIYRDLFARHSAFERAFAIFIIDDKGTLVATSRTPNPDVFDFSDHEVFRAHKDNPGTELYIEGARKGEVGYARDRWIFNVSRRLNQADGSLAGVIAITISVDAINEFYEALRRGPSDVVGMARDDGTLVVRSPLSPEFIGRKLSDTILFREKLPLADTGVYRADFVTDGVDRINAYGRVPNAPAVVYVGVALTEPLAAWRQRAVVDGALALVTLLVLGGLIVVIWRRMDERRRERDARVEQLTKLTEISTALFESSSVETALKLAVATARQLVPCHQAVISLTENPSMSQAIQAVSLSEKYAAWQDYDEKPDGSGIYRLVCETNQPMRLTQTELEAQVDWKGFGVARERHPPMRGWLALPLMSDDGANLGLIQLSDRTKGEFSEEDQALIAELAHVTRVAIQRLGMAGQLEDAALNAQRLRSEMESILTSIHDAVYALDVDWRFTFLNPQAEKVLERKAEDLIGRKVWDEFPETVDTVLFEQYHQARASNVDVDFRFHYPPLGRWFDVRAFPQKEGGLTVYFQDVSNLILQEEQLRQAQKMDAVGQLTGGVAHDFNNLLTVILGNTEAVLSEIDPGDPRHRLVSMIGSAAERAADLTQRLLAFSRRQPLDPRAVEVNSLIQGLEPLLTRTLGEQYQIRFVLEEGTRKALVDAGQLQNAIINLALNARDAMPGGGDLTIETTEVQIDDDYIETHIYASGGCYVMIAVNDTGTGMTPETRARAFEPFFTTKQAGHGTGLGLSMVYGFIKQSQGHVNIYSEPGQGTTVKLYLPCAADGDSPESKDEAAGAVEKGAEHILVVEDDPLVREYTASSLILLGYDVVAVPDGPAAIATIGSRGDFDLLLCDVILGGGMNGREVADAARERIPGLKILFMSGYSEDVIVHQGRLDEGVKLLMKPFRRADLASKVRETLDGPDTRRVPVTLA